MREEQRLADQARGRGRGLVLPPSAALRQVRPMSACAVCCKWGALGRCLVMSAALPVLCTYGMQARSCLPFTVTPAHSQSNLMPVSGQGAAAGCSSSRPA